MKPHLVFTLFLACASCLLAQEPAPSASVPPLPAGPLLKRTPEYSTWTVTFQGHPVEVPATGEASNKEKEPVASVSTVIKTGSTILEQTVDAAGQQRQVWHFSGIRITPNAGSPNAIVSPDYGGGDITSINFASSDFAGLDWLSPSTYSGVAKYQGHDCIVFKGTVSPLSFRAQIDEREDIEKAKAFGQPHPEKITVPAVALIDLETRLPLYVKFGNEKRTYQYGTPPSAPQVLPPELADAVEEYAKRIKRLSAPAPKAY